MHHHVYLKIQGDLQSQQNKHLSYKMENTYNKFKKRSKNLDAPPVFFFRNPKIQIKKKSKPNENKTSESNLKSI